MQTATQIANTSCVPVPIPTPGSTSSSASGTWGETESSVSHYDGYTAYHINGFYIAASGNAPGGPYLNDNQFHETFTDSDPPVLPHAGSGTGAANGYPISSTNPIPPGGWLTITPTNPSTAASGVASLQVSFKPILAYAAGGEVDFTTIKNLADPPPPQKTDLAKTTDAVLAGAKSVWDWLCDGVSTIAKNAVKAAQEIYNDPLSGVSNLANGFANTITCGLTGRIQHWVGNNVYIDKKSAAYSTGEVAGTAVEIGLGVGNPCTAAGWASTGLKALNAAEFVGNSLNLGEHLSNGEYLAAAGDVLGMMNNISQMRRSCFAFETPMVAVADGQIVGKRAEDVRRGDILPASPEDDPNGPIVPCRVEEVFSNTAAVIRLNISGQVIRTTPQHRIYIKDRGWIDASLAKPGELFRTRENAWLPIDAIEDRGEIVPVYNFRIANYHTYFVGDPSWGFSLWAHNTCVYTSTDPKTGKVNYVGITDKFDARKAAHALLRGIEIKVVEGLESLTRKEARAVEQALIELYKLGKNGGSLINKINSIARNNPVYSSAREIATGILNKLHFPGL